MHTLRDDVIPAAVAGTGVEASVGGTTAAYIDDSEQTRPAGCRCSSCVLLSFVLLMSVFRSLPVAVKAAVMNILSIGAAYGVMALAANGGWFGEPPGSTTRRRSSGGCSRRCSPSCSGCRWTTRCSSCPGCARSVRTGDNRRAVADGLANTARVITAAAIMVTVFGAFVMEDAVFLKLAGIGLATAVFVDATVVRMILVPATMELLGDRNWWLPRWLDRLPCLEVEGEAGPLATAPHRRRPGRGGARHRALLRSSADRTGGNCEYSTLRILSRAGHGRTANGRDRPEFRDGARAQAAVAARRHRAPSGRPAAPAPARTPLVAVAAGARPQPG